MLDTIAGEFMRRVERIPAAMKPSCVLLVGGLANSRVVQARLTAAFAGAGMRTVTIADSTAAVVRGAVLAGLRRAPRCLGHVFVALA